MTLFVGIDVSSKELETCFMNTDGDKLETLTVKNNLEGAAHLRDRIVALADKHAVSEIHIGLESTSVYSWHPAMYLHSDPTLQERHTKVFTMNPKLVSKFRETYPDLNKTDRLDAWVIADRLRFGRLTTTIVMQEQYVALQRLTRMRFHLIHNLTREKQYFLQNLFYKCNAFTTEVESSVFGHAILEMLSEKYSLDDIATMDVGDLADYLRDKGRNRFPDPENVARCIQKAARASYRLSKVVEDSIDLVLGTSIQAIRSIQAQLKDLDKAIEQILETIPGSLCLRSVPGIDRVYAAGILAEIGDIERFSDQAAVAKYAGLTWRKSQSGAFEAEDTKRIKSGNRFLRYYLVEAANSVKNRDEEFGEYYRKKYKEVPKHQHKRALVLTARKLVRLVDVLLRNGQLYTPRKKVTPAKD
ncbi:IS110 family transposase [Paenibacillus doosanensis]|uniref:Transposase IS116/IS110/IS902 family protein n=1 Tax=Paenibacillus konkukensis TaxID=2020716 RepID=A0ABY4RS95_9BACL|nr:MULTISPECIES: IS110 family transposase [Paenibacillus]MCS7465035.1 IS110 family transposase [Paenibacillus doosanensis]UQZ81022.1 Transposase IS116/IS110/IS902 family protein [Paenibacillus konkukensis]UQZ81040.1 Transposase IS116/IS110/IS902 family protein [Paenibacillus konkukensis]UQZ83341.1 Transposase IS116/IS110/IS902 family protein [Paenibacillus konkukensis]UQZ83437.1 Transposase IS116/IS110/IS902 family protein [Paenibacillus konkukensis]